MSIPDDAIDVNVSSTSNRRIFFPPEICALIIESGMEVLTQNELHALVAVSRSFRDESERLLYQKPNLWNTAKVIGFCSTIRRRRHLANRIHQLVIYMGPQTDFQADDLAEISNTLRLCVNLNALSIHHQSDRTNARLAPRKWEELEVHTWILNDHVFQLSMFENTYFDLASLRRFIRSQSTLETLLLNCEGNGLYHIPFRRLKHLSCLVPVLQELSVGGMRSRREIESLQLSIVGSSREAVALMIDNLILLRGTLTKLHVQRYMSGERRGLDFDGLVVAVARSYLPALTALIIMDLCSKDGYSNAPFGPFSFPDPFPQLETLWLCPPFKRPARPSILTTDSYHSELNTEAGRLAAATRIMARISTLKRLGLVTPGHTYVYQKHIGEDGTCAELFQAGPTMAITTIMIPL